MNDYKGIISLLIFCVEIVLLINVLIFSKSKFKSNIVLILSLLATYQFFEFLICGFKLQTGFVIYLAFVTITFLPPSGLLLAMKVNRIKKSKINGLIFSPAIFFSLYYLLTIKEFRVKECSVIYASYYYPLGFLYGLFYYIPIAISLFIFIRGIINQSDKTLKKQNLILLIGFLSFPIPMILSLITYPETINFIESLMCKFAFALALIISYFALYFKK